MRTIKSRILYTYVSSPINCYSNSKTSVMKKIKTLSSFWLAPWTNISVRLYEKTLAKLPTCSIQLTRSEVSSLNIKPSRYPRGTLVTAALYAVLCILLAFALGKNLRNSSSSSFEVFRNAIIIFVILWISLASIFPRVLFEDIGTIKGFNLVLNNYPLINCSTNKPDIPGFLLFYFILGNVFLRSPLAPINWLLKIDPFTFIYEELFAIGSRPYLSISGVPILVCVFVSCITSIKDACMHTIWLSTCFISVEK